jgi:hypothetical protein
VGGEVGAGEVGVTCRSGKPLYFLVYLIEEGQQVFLDMFSIKAHATIASLATEILQFFIPRPYIWF